MISLQSKDEEYIEYLLDVEKQQNEVRKHRVIEEEIKQKNVKKQRKQAMIDELVRSVILEFLSWHFFP
jgi:hypothetical protein